MALIDDLPRSATARVTQPTRLLILYRTHFESLVEGDRAVALAITRNLLRMLASYVRSFPACRAARRAPGSRHRAVVVSVDLGRGGRPPRGGRERATPAAGLHPRPRPVSRRPPDDDRRRIGNPRGHVGLAAAGRP